MRRTVRAAATVALLTATTASVGCDGPAPDAGPPTTAPTSPAELSPGPLRLPSRAPGDRCPTTAPKPWSGPGEATQVLGPGPVYPVADYFRDGAVLRLREDDRQPDGTYRKKVRWIATGYTGPVLVRAARIDAPGSATVAFSYTGGPRDGGHYAVLTNPDSDLPGTTTVDGPGCYAYQVDGTTFSLTIVFRAAPEAPSSAGSGR
ncbi:hypothetical protein I0C86_28330 [Plantactinospora sp. S1510]|uniref:Uncharacterized protein n=1 Tax=Plantactinospora alkalitolerans TaxID=2789879 RepID=A0ABS0H2Z6_9ACTN|nr:hypothetical protein [Plantactinospora alkalitolerans]MBF9132835.1 hypothetical protein [Plantactinospora alkalitolerans]